MNLVRSYYRRLFPAAVMTAGFSALAHAALVAVAAGTVGLELVAIASLSFAVAIVVALAGGAVLLAIVGVLKLKPLSSLLLFFVAVQLVAIRLAIYLFELQDGWAEIPWQYGLISVPASLIAWHQSVYHVQRRI